MRREESRTGQDARAPKLRKRAYFSANPDTGGPPTLYHSKTCLYSQMSFAVLRVAKCPQFVNKEVNTEEWEHFRWDFAKHSPKMETPIVVGASEVSGVAKTLQGFGDIVEYCCRLGESRDEASAQANDRRVQSLLNLMCKANIESVVYQLAAFTSPTFAFLVDYEIWQKRIIKALTQNCKEAQEKASEDGISPNAVRRMYDEVRVTQTHRHFTEDLSDILPTIQEAVLDISALVERAEDKELGHYLWGSNELHFMDAAAAIWVKWLMLCNEIRPDTIRIPEVVKDYVSRVFESDDVRNAFPGNDFFPALKIRSDYARTDWWIGWLGFKGMPLKDDGPPLTPPRIRGMENR